MRHGCRECFTHRKVSESYWKVALRIVRGTQKQLQMLRIYINSPDCIGSEAGDRINRSFSSCMLFCQPATLQFSLHLLLSKVNINVLKAKICLRTSSVV